MRRHDPNVNHEGEIRDRNGKIAHDTLAKQATWCSPPLHTNDIVSRASINLPVDSGLVLPPHP